MQGLGLAFNFKLGRGKPRLSSGRILSSLIGTVMDNIRPTSALTSNLTSFCHPSFHLIFHGLFRLIFLLYHYFFSAR